MWAVEGLFRVRSFKAPLCNGLRRRTNQFLCAAFALALPSVAASPGTADESNPSTAATEQATSAPISFHSMVPMAGPLTANQNAAVIDAGPFGNVYVSGVVSGLAQWQTHATSADRGAQADLSNAQIFVQKTDGVVQFFVQAGVYSLPSLGTPYANALETGATFMDRFHWPSSNLCQTTNGRSWLASFRHLTGSNTRFRSRI